MDREASPLSGYLLVNDLDLYVYDSNGITYKAASGNGYFDSLNNVEQIELNNLPITNLSVSVFARRVALGPQNFIIVMTGDLTDASSCAATLSVCPNQCSGYGTCVVSSPGYQCSCNSGRSGVDCSLSLSCPTDNSGNICGGNGVCDYASGNCTCYLGYSLPTCSGKNVVVNSTTVATVFTSKKSPYSAGLVAGSVIAAFFVGAIISIFLGGFLAVKYLEYRRDKAAKERTEEMQT